MFESRTLFRVTSENEHGFHAECNLEGEFGLTVYEVPTEYFLESVEPNLPEGMKVLIGFSDYTGPVASVSLSYVPYGKNELRTV